jgi:hypothetical protein
MNRLSVTIVDILGVLVPGAVLLLGCFFVPPPLAPIPALTGMVDKSIQLLSNPWVVGGVWLATAYVLGFLLRLVSIPFMNILTKHRWAPRLKLEADTLEQVFEEAIANLKLSTSLKELSKLYGERDPGRYAPYFHFAKRLVRKHPDMWTEAERLEAEIRFAAGLFLPFLLLLIDGIALRPTRPPAWVLIVIGALGAGIVIFAFPSRRVKEVLYNYFLALAILLDPVRRSTTSPEKCDKGKVPPVSGVEAPNPGPQADSYAAA